MIENYVTFHLFFPVDHAPLEEEDIFDGTVVNSFEMDCTEYNGLQNSFRSYRKDYNLTYPVNVARNIARAEARTLFVLASDIELWPNPGLVQGFLNMMSAKHLQQKTNPRVFVVPIFEIKLGQDLPETKLDLVNYLEANITIPFHISKCYNCHTIPGAEEWYQDFKGYHV